MRVALATRLATQILDKRSPAESVRFQGIAGLLVAHVVNCANLGRWNHRRCCRRFRHCYARSRPRWTVRTHAFTATAGDAAIPVGGVPSAAVLTCVGGAGLGEDRVVNRGHCPSPFANLADRAPVHLCKLCQVALRKTIVLARLSRAIVSAVNRVQNRPTWVLGDRRRNICVVGNRIVVVGRFRVSFLV